MRLTHYQISQLNPVIRFVSADPKTLTTGTRRRRWVKIEIEVTACRG